MQLPEGICVKCVLRDGFERSENGQGFFVGRDCPRNLCVRGPLTARLEVNVRDNLQTRSGEGAGACGCTSGANVFREPIGWVFLCEGNSCTKSSNRIELIINTLGLFGCDFAYWLSVVLLGS